MNISLRHLQYFQLLCQHGHFGHAANAASVSQPALSMKIKELEEILKTPLIDRDIKPYVPTPIGAEVLARANLILDGVQNIETLAAKDRGVEGTFQLGVIPTVAPYILPKVLPVIQRDLPKLDLRIREATTKELLEELQDGKLDACILATEPDGENLADMPLFTDDFLLAIERGLAQGLGLKTGHISLTEIATLKLLLLSEGHCFREQAQSICRYASSETLNQIGASSLQTLLGLAAGGYGATLIPQMALEQTGAGQALTYLRLADPQPNRTIRLVSKKNQQQGLHLDGLMSILKQYSNASPNR